MPRRKSKLWNHFSEIEDRKAKCGYCLQFVSLACGSTGNLMRHLKAKHPTSLTFRGFHDCLLKSNTQSCASSFANNMDGCTKTGTTTRPKFGSRVFVKQEVISESEHEPSSSIDDRGSSQDISGAWTHLTFPKIKEEIESDSHSSDDDLEMNNQLISGTSIPNLIPNIKETIKDEPKVFGIHGPFQDDPDMFATSNVVFETVNKREYNDDSSEPLSTVPSTFKNEPCFENTDLKMAKKYDQTQSEIISSSSPSIRDQQSINKGKPNCAVTKSIKTKKICELCGKVFSKKTNLSIHRSAVHSELRPYKCNVCGIAFKRKGDFNKHLKLHNKEKVLKCQFCGECFTQKRDLNRHTRTTHIEQRRFMCKLCGKSFVKKQGLDYHSYTHEEGIFVCEFCGKSCRLKSLFIKHKKTHTDERPFICECCGKGFKWKADLKRHRQYVNCKERPFRCESCDMCFRFNVARIEHMRIHS